MPLSPFLSLDVMLTNALAALVFPIITVIGSSNLKKETNHSTSSCVPLPTASLLHKELQRITKIFSKKKKKSAKRANPIKLQLESESKTLSRFYANTEVIVLQEAALDLLTLALPQFLPQQRGDQRKLGARGQALLTTTTQE